MKLSRLVGLVPLSVALAAPAMAAYNCQDALHNIQGLAIYGTYYNSSIVSDVDRIKDISQSMNNSIQSLGEISQSAQQFQQIGAAMGSIVDSAMVGNTQEAYNNAYNANVILSEALSRCGSDSECFRAHANNAIGSIKNSMSYAQRAENGANSVKAKANQLEQRARQAAQGLSNAIGRQRNHLDRATDGIQRVTYGLMGWSPGNWGQPAPNSKLGYLNSEIEYMIRNACVRSN